MKLTSFSRQEYTWERISWHVSSIPGNPLQISPGTQHALQRGGTSAHVEHVIHFPPPIRFPLTGDGVQQLDALDSNKTVLLTIFPNIVFFLPTPCLEFHPPWCRWWSGSSSQNPTYVSMVRLYSRDAEIIAQMALKAFFVFTIQSMSIANLLVCLKNLKRDATVVTGLDDL